MPAWLKDELARSAQTGRDDTSEHSDDVTAPADVESITSIQINRNLSPGTAAARLHDVSITARYLHVHEQIATVISEEYQCTFFILFSVEAQAL